MQIEYSGKIVLIIANPIFRIKLAPFVQTMRFEGG